MRILLIEDDRDLADLMWMLLSCASDEVLIGHDGASAVQMALDFHPDVVLLDIGLPDLSGHEVAKRIRREPTLADVVLVALTGFDGKAHRATSMEAGFDYHLVKGAGFGPLQEILNTVARRRCVSGQP
ncbi:MAG: response regulator [Acidobacteriota bacterium]